MDTRNIYAHICEYMYILSLSLYIYIYYPLQGRNSLIMIFVKCGYIKLTIFSSHCSIPVSCGDWKR